MKKYPTQVEGKNGWSDWIAPIMRGYGMACCDCGLVHDIQFRAIEVVKNRKRRTFEYVELSASKYRIIFRAKRNTRATGQIRRRKKK